MVRAGVVALLPLWAGCIRGSLATGTGPNGPELWCTAGKQDAHVGETVRFSFILVNPMRDRPIDPFGYADYCVAAVGGRRVLCEPDLKGHFRFEHRLDEAKPGDRIKVTATAYREYGRRDFMEVGDTWLRGESTVDEPDRRVCSDSLKLRVYQAMVEMSLPGGPVPLDLESGRLQLIKRDGEASSVFIDRPGRPGFVANGPDESGNYTIVYQPTGDELNPSGQTQARFTVSDLAGHQHSAEAMVPSP